MSVWVGSFITFTESFLYKPNITEFATILSKNIILNVRMKISKCFCANDICSQNLIGPNLRVIIDLNRA